jgi:hypothetical protein
MTASTFQRISRIMGHLGEEANAKNSQEGER